MQSDLRGGGRSDAVVRGARVAAGVEAVDPPDRVPVRVLPGHAALGEEVVLEGENGI